MATPKRRTRPVAPVALQGPRDEIDRALLGLLQTHARQSTADLARQLGIARTTVLSRLQRMERDRVILGYSVQLGQDEQDAGLQAFVHIAVQPRSGRGIEARLQRMPEVRLLCTVSGEFDYVARLHTPSALRLDAVIDEIGGLDGVIRTQTSVVLARRIDRTTS